MQYGLIFDKFENYMFPTSHGLLWFIYNWIFFIVSCSLIFLEVILLLFQINQTGLIAYVQENAFSEPTDLQKWMKKKENDYHQSKERIARICSKWERKPLNKTSFVKRLLFVDKYKIVLCKNDKVRKSDFDIFQISSNQY